jgi:hypothetical protein
MDGGGGGIEREEECLEKYKVYRDSVTHSVGDAVR